jgi:hypothetical protein
MAETRRKQIKELGSRPKASSSPKASSICAAGSVSSRLNLQRRPAQHVGWPEGRSASKGKQLANIEESEVAFKTFRLIQARQIAIDEIKRMGSPKSPKAMRAKMKKVASAVASALCTSPTVALNGYIDPEVWKKWQTSAGPSNRTPRWPGVVAKARAVEQLFAKRFRARWRAVSADLARGIDVAKERADFFLASDSRTRLRLARRYYTPARAAKFAGASTNEIVTLCWAWFNPFQLFALRSGNDLDEIGDHLNALVGNEYVAMTWGLLNNVPSYVSSTMDIDLNFPEMIEEFYGYDPPQVFPFPDADNYGDVFEAIVYSYCGEHLRVCKSVSEPFLLGERGEAMNEIEELFLQNADEEGDDPRSWRVSFRRLTSRLLPEFGRALIEADIFGEVATSEGKEYFRTLKAELNSNGDGYLKRS